MPHNHDAVIRAAERARLLRRVERVEALLAEVRALRGGAKCGACGAVVVDDDAAEAEGWRWHIEGDELVARCATCSQ
jgi:hypothetical protein